MKDNEYIVKAKTIDNKWVCGFYSRVTDNYTPRNIHYITTYSNLPNGETILNEIYEIIPETICRPSGLEDVDGNIIWEHDIVKTINNDLKGIIIFNRYQFAINITESECVLSLGLTFPLWQYDNCKENGYRQLQIIGNKYDDYTKDIEHQERE